MSKKQKKAELIEEKDITPIVSENKIDISDVVTESEQTLADASSTSSESSKNIDTLDSKEIKNEIDNNSEDEIKETTENKLEDLNNDENLNSEVELQLQDTLDVVPSGKKSHKTLFIVTFSFAIILVLFFLFSTMFALASSSSSTIISGVSIKDIDVSGLTREQALEKVSSAFDEKLAQSITLKHNEYETSVSFTQFDVSFSLEEAVDLAYSKGRTR